ncbi:MAG TPA: class I SAM-dependent methyltransferase [Halalkalibaculum sp.]|nr:class I SAM-dependent methyltransferase [Halalkalibaculum sp.]
MTHPYKEELFSGLSGSILEIGAGTGANLDYYPQELDLWMLEPSPYMRNYLQEKAKEADQNIHMISGFAENMPFPAEKFDAVVATLVLCSVEDVEESLSEIYRVLKPGGRFYFIEHVAARENSWLRTLQNWITPLWKVIADGCHPNRNTAEWIRRSGFTDVQIERTRVNIPVVGPHIIGSAVKPK